MAARQSLPLSRFPSALKCNSVTPSKYISHFPQGRIENSRTFLHQRRSQHTQGIAVSAPNGTTGQVCNWIDSVQLQDIPAEIQRKVKYLILDGIACAIVGAKLPWSKVPTEAILRVSDKGQATVFGWANKNTSPLNAALLNGTFIQGFELDDVHVHAPWHANSIILPALFAGAEYYGQTGAEPAPKFDGANFLCSTIVGFELGSRVGRALYGSEMLSQGWHSGAVFGPPAAAAAVSKLLGLSPGQTEDAIGSACTQACGLMSAQYESMAKRMQHGFAARNGLFAAFLAKEGYTGIDQVFERPYGGYLATFGQGSRHDPKYRENELTDELGKDWRGIEGVRVKPYSSMISTHAPVDCISALQEKYPAKFSDLENIEGVTIEQSEAPFAHGGQDIDRPINTVGAQMSTKYIAAAQLLDREILIDQFNDENINRDAIWDLANKTSCLWNRDFDGKSKWYTRVTVRFKDGDIVTEEVPVSQTMGSLLSEEKIKEKWKMLTDRVIDAKLRDQLEDMILNLEKVEDMREMIQLLGAEMRSAV